MKTFNFIIRGNEYEVEIKSLEDNIAKIDVNGTLYNVELQKKEQTSKTPVLVRKPVVHSPDSAKIKQQQSSLQKVIAPLPGNILKVFVKEGDTISEGDNLLIYEAMKMENTLKAEKPGVVKSLKVKEGDAVLQDAVLIEVEL